MKANWKKRSESGASMTIFAVMGSVLMLCLALAVDLSPAIGERIEQEHVLAQVSERAALPSGILEDSQNESGTPSAVANRLLSAVRECGFEGDVTIWFYEPAEGDYAKVDANDRIWVWGVELESEVHANLAGFVSPAASDSIQVSSHVYGNGNAFSRVRVYRQNGGSSLGRAYRWEGHAGTNSLSDMNTLTPASAFAEAPGLRTELDRVLSLTRSE